MTSKPGKQTITINIMNNISKSKNDQTTIFSQFIEYNMRNNFLAAKMLFPYPYLKNKYLTYTFDFNVCQIQDYQNILKLSCRPQQQYFSALKHLWVQTKKFFPLKSLLYFFLKILLRKSFLYFLVKNPLFPGNRKHIKTEFFSSAIKKFLIFSYISEKRYSKIYFSFRKQKP